MNYFGNFSGLCALISGYCVPFVLISETWVRNARAKNARICRGLLARPNGFEPLTPRFVVWCSIQLSYGRVLRIAREVFSQRRKPPGTRL